MKNIRLLLLLFVLILVLLACESGSKNEPGSIDFCTKSEGVRIVHFIDLKNCISCGTSWSVPDSYIPFLDLNCSYIVPSYKLPNNEELLSMHLTKDIVNQSSILSNPDLYKSFQEKYYPEGGSFVLVFDNLDSLLFMTSIERYGINNIEMIINLN